MTSEVITDDNLSTDNIAPEETGPGQLLSRKREALGLSVQEVAEQLHITMHYVRSLESNAHDKLPGDVFIRGYIRAYANLLKLDPVVLINVYNEFSSQQRSALEASHSRARRRRDRNRPWIIVSGIAFVGIAVALWYFSTTQVDSQGTPATDVNSAAGRSEVTTVPVLPEGAATIDNVAATAAVPVVPISGTSVPTAVVSNTAAADGASVVQIETVVESTRNLLAGDQNVAAPNVTTPNVTTAELITQGASSQSAIPGASAAVSGVAAPGIAAPGTVLPSATEPPVTEPSVTEPSGTAPATSAPTTSASATSTPAASDAATALPNASPAAQPSAPAPQDATAGDAADAQARVITVDAGGDDLIQITFTGQSMVQVDDGTDKQIYSDMRTAGDVLRITGSAPFNILLGDAAVAELSLNGNRIDFTSSIRIDNSARLTIGL